MYSRRIGDETLAFGHEGILYKRSFIMYDRGTKSLWVHVTGEAVRGKRKGQQLEFIPSVVMKWGDWKKRYPKSTVLEGRNARGMMGSYRLDRETSKYGLSVGEGKQVRLYRFVDLEKTPVINDGATVVVYDKTSGTARAFARGEQKFAMKDDVFVNEMGVEFDPFTGRAGTVALDPVPATVWLLNRWRAHNPGGAIYKPK